MIYTDYLHKMLVRRRALIIFWTAFIGIGALIGSMMFFCDPQNGFVMGSILPVMRAKMPFGELLFSNFIFSGISLLIVNGISNLTACALIIMNKKAGYIMGSVFGLTLMMWIAIQFYIFAPELYAIDVVFFLFGLLQLICGYAAYAAYMQNLFREEPLSDTYSRGNRKAAVVYFSRMGYVRRLARKKAEALGCDLIELKTSEPTAHISGFWWCGRFAMHRWGMKLLPVTEDIASYEKLYIYTPVWAFAVSAPVRQFLTDYDGKIKSAEITAVHFMKGKLPCVFREPEKLLGSRLVSTASVSCKFGNTADG